MEAEASPTGAEAAACSAKELKAVAVILILGTVFLVLLFVSIQAPAPPSGTSSTDRLELICAVVVLGLVFVGSLAAYLVRYRLRLNDQVRPVMPNFIVDSSLVGRPPPA